MPSKTPDVGGLAQLDVLYGAAAKMTSFTLQLLTIMTMADTDINTTHTVAVGGGYADISLTNNATIAAVGGIPMAVWAVQEWTFTGPLTTNPTIVGYQVKSGTTLLFEEVLVSPITPTTNGDKVRITPRYALGNGTPT